MCIRDRLKWIGAVIRRTRVRFSVASDCCFERYVLTYLLPCSRQTPEADCKDCETRANNWTSYWLQCNKTLLITQDSGWRQCPTAESLRRWRASFYSDRQTTTPRWCRELHQSSTESYNQTKCCHLNSTNLRNTSCALALIADNLTSDY